MVEVSKGISIMPASLLKLLLDDFQYRFLLFLYIHQVKIIIYITNIQKLDESNNVYRILD